MIRFFAYLCDSPVTNCSRAANLGLSLLSNGVEHSLGFLQVLHFRNLGIVRFL